MILDNWQKRFPVAGKFFISATMFLLVGLAVGALAASPPRVGPADAAKPARVVAVGDVHGDYDALVAILQRAALIDAKLNWIGDGATLVQTGDFLDRGQKCREVMDLLISLEKQAARKKGRVIVILGNHEAMNLYGDLRYAKNMFASFADKNSEKRRADAWRDYVKWQTARAKELGKPEPVLSDTPDDEWLKAHPLGFFEQREAFAPTGKYGRWLREHSALAVVDGTLFVHGGISPELASWKIEAISKRVADEIAAFDLLSDLLVKRGILLPFFTLEEATRAAQEEKLARETEIAEKQAAAAKEGKTYKVSEAEKVLIGALSDFLNYPNWFTVHRNGPLWFRGYDSWTDEEGLPQVEKILAGLGVSRIVVGHSTQKLLRINARFGGRVFLIDTGMLSAYYPGGRASVLELHAGRATAVYLDDRILLHDSAAQPAGAAPGTKLFPADDIPGGGVSESFAPAPNGSPAAAQPARIWMGPDGKPLPFRTDAELLEFMRTANVVSTKTMGTGITRPKRVKLKLNGIVMNAFFRDVNEERDVAKLANGQVEVGFRDSYLFECAAYELSLLLGYDNVPPVTLRKINGQPGSIQVWLEGVTMETDRLRKKTRPPDVSYWNRQVQMMKLFDALIYNTDRNAGNILIDSQWKLWMIDHTRAFRRHEDPMNAGNIVIVEKTVWERLQTVKDEEIRTRLTPYLRKQEIEALLKRRVRLVAILQKLIASRGEKEVLFTLSRPEVTPAQNPN